MGRVPISIAICFRVIAGLTEEAESSFFFFFVLKEKAIPVAYPEILFAQITDYFFLVRF